jgi:hypothetical protein
MLTCNASDMTEPCGLPFPDEICEVLDQPRSKRIHEHWVPINLQWWDDALRTRQLPGGPLQVTYGAGRAGISRGALFELATDKTADGELRLLWHTLAWGGGMKARLMNKRLDSITADPARATEALRTAAAAARTSPADAFEVLYPLGRTFLKYLGPAFFTKYLYFAGGGSPTHPCVILDRVTADRLRSHGWGGVRSAGWSTSTYVRYCELLACWARHASVRIGRDVVADEIELWLFQS